MPPACAKPPGVGSGPYVDADVVDMPNAPSAPGDTNYDYGDAAPVAQWVHDHPDVSIGPYVSGNHIYVGFSKDAESNLQTLRHDTGEGSNVRGYRVKYSGAEVAATYQAISADRDYLAQQGIQVNANGGDAMTDTAFAMVSTADDHACNVFLQRYGGGRFYLIEGKVINT